MAEIKVFQLDCAFSVGVRDLGFILVFLHNGVAPLVIQIGSGDGVTGMAFPGDGFRPVAGFALHGFREDVLLFKQHFQRSHDLLQFPLAGVHGGQNRRQHIGVMPDIVQLIVVFVVVMGLLIPIKLPLQCLFHSAVGCFRTHNIIVSGGIAACSDSRTDAFHHHGAGGHGIQEECQNQQDTKDGGKPFSVPRHKGCRLFRLFGSFLCSPGAALHGTASGFLGSILALDGLPLTPPGQGVAGGMFHLRFLLQGVDVGFLQLLFRTGSGTVGLELGRTVSLLKKMG